MRDTLKRSPDEIPALYAADLEKLHKQCRRILDLKMVPYFIQAALAKEGYVTVEDLADRWNTPEDARQKAPKELNLEPGSNHYDAASTRFPAMPRYQAARMAKTPSSTAPAQLLVPHGHTAQLCL